MPADDTLFFAPLVQVSRKISVNFDPSNDTKGRKIAVCVGILIFDPKTIREGQKSVDEPLTLKPQGGSVLVEQKIPCT